MARRFLQTAAQTMRRLGVGAMALAGLCGTALCGQAWAQAPADDPRPLSPAQVALFETPHLRNVDRPETLDYGFTREGPGGFADTVALHVRRVNPDGTKSLAFDYLTGEHRVAFPELDNFNGNPLLMLTLERDVNEMKEAVGVSAAYFRNKVREAFVTKATVADGTFDLAGAAVPARVITVQPFAEEQRLERIPSLQAKRYTFVLADAVPGMLAEISIDTPADAKMNAPAFHQRTVFTGVEP